MTSACTVTASNPNGAAYLDADQFPHQSVRLSTEEHHAQGKGFSVHIYTDEDGIYDRDRLASWSLLKSNKIYDNRIFESRPWIEPRMYIYGDTKNRIFGKGSNKSAAPPYEWYGKPELRNFVQHGEPRGQK